VKIKLDTVLMVCYTIVVEQQIRFPEILKPGEVEEVVMQNYKGIRGRIAEDRCTNKSEYGSPLYCDCGCHTPRDTDPVLNLSDVTIIRKSGEGHANYILSRNGVECGSYNSQYSAIYMDGNEYLGVSDDVVAHLLAIVRSGVMDKPSNDTNAGSTLEETAASESLADKLDLAEQDAKHGQHPGHCTKCHSYCYGDCEAN